jgi:hypothetical protein
LKEEFVGRTSGVTPNELFAAMMGIVKKDDDDNYKTEKGTGNYKIPSGYGLSNEEFTNIVKLVYGMIAEGFGDYSFELIEEIGQAGFQADPAKMFADFMNAIGGAVKEGMTVEQRQRA